MTTRASDTQIRFKAPWAALLRLLRAGVAGIGATLADLGALAFLSSVIGLNVRVASLPALLLGGIVNFLLNRSFAFRANRGPLLRQIALYAAVEGVALALNGVLFDFVIRTYPVTHHAYPLVRLATGHLVFLLWSYPLWSRVFVAADGADRRNRGTLMRVKAPFGALPYLVALLATTFSLSCGGGSFPRDTTARNGRADDPYLEGGERCAPGSNDNQGLRIETIEAGTGKTVGEGETVRVHYVAQLPNGTVVHDTRLDGAPIELIIGSTKVICGFERALVGMKAGEQRRVSVPWQQAFGESGKPPTVPARSELVFVVDLFLPADPGAGRGSGGH